jgi:hypothetical protein
VSTPVIGAMSAKPPYLDDPDALITAADQGHFEFVHALLAAGADPNMTNGFGDTPVIAAARHGHDEIIELLIAHGADVNAEDRDGDTALHVAKHHGRDSTARLLLDHGAHEVDGPSAKQLMMEAVGAQARALVKSSIRLPSSIMTDPYAELTRLSEALAHKHDAEGLWPMMVESSRAMLGADGCTFYLVRDGHLHVEVLISQSLGLTLDASAGFGSIAAPTPIFRPEGGVDESSLAAVCAASCEPINVPDVRELPSWTRSRRFDERMGYRTVSVLSVPVLARGHIFGVLQFVNALDGSGRVGAFTAHHESIAHSIATLMSLAQLIFNVC